MSGFRRTVDQSGDDGRDLIFTKKVDKCGNIDIGVKIKIKIFQTNTQFNVGIDIKWA